MQNCSISIVSALEILQSALSHQYNMDATVKKRYGQQHSQLELVPQHECTGRQHVKSNMMETLAMIQKTLKKFH